MSDLPQKKLTKWDVLTLSAVFFLACLIGLKPFLAPPSDSFTVTTQSGTAAYSLSESVSRNIESNGFNYTVTTENGKVYVSAADCPDGTCKKSNPISKPGESIVCVPGKMIIAIPDPNEEDDDEVYFVG